MGEDIYRTLMKHLGEVGIGYPQIDEFLEVLRKTITPEEAEVALGLPIRLPPMEVEEVDAIARRAHKSAEHVAPIKKRLVPRDYIMATYYLRTTDEEECIGCGRCAEDCPMEIITMVDDKPVVDETVCIGCGVCLLHCPTGAAKLKRKDEKTPFLDFNTVHRTAIKESISKKQTS